MKHPGAIPWWFVVLALLAGLAVVILTGCEAVRVGERVRLCVGVCAEVEVKHAIEGQKEKGAEAPVPPVVRDGCLGHPLP